VLARAITTKPKEHAGLRRFARTDRVRNVSARLHGPPYIEPVQLSFAEIVEGFSALWVGAFSNHWQLPPLRPAETNVPHARKTHNEAFVLEPGTVVRGLSDQLPLDRIHYCFQAVVGAEFLVDVVKVIAKGLRANAQGVGNIITILAFGEQAQDMLLLLG
jgi:hypothetical protein